MKRIWAGVGLLAVAGFGTAALATPSGADDKPQPKEVDLGATWSPNPAAPGEDVTLTPDKPCPLDVDKDNGNVSKPGVVFVHTDDQGGGFEIPMNDDGSWSYTAKAPDEPGTYSLVAECRSGTWEEEMRWCGVTPDDVRPDGKSDESFKPISYTKPAAPTWNWFNCEFEFFKADLTVQAPGSESTTTTSAPESTTPPPATPIPEVPHETG
jgi:hypothetical protein